MNMPTGGGAPSKSNFEIQKALLLVYRHIWVVLVTFVVVTVASLLFFHEKKDQQYESTTVVMVRPSATGTLADTSDAMTMWAAVLDWQRYRSTQLKIMTSNFPAAKPTQNKNRRRSIS